MRIKLLILFFLFSLVFLIGCSGAASTATPTTAVVIVPDNAPPTITPTLDNRELPITFTPAPTYEPPTATPYISPTPSPTRPTATPIPFGETAVELIYSIPALNLERRLQGNIASQIIFVDEMTGEARQRSNQSSILLELQQVLPDLELEPVPQGCDSCVHFEYSLPLSEKSGSGWLRDPVLLASVENLMAVVLGPHFREDTILGLRRSASPYFPAHTIHPHHRRPCLGLVSDRRQGRRTVNLGNNRSTTGQHVGRSASQ